MKIIAEVGSNWRSIADCLYHIKKAAELGAWAVKFQYFSEFDLYGSGSTVRQFKEDDFMKMKACAIDNKIELLCTAFSTSGLRDVNPFVKYHKIASAELTHDDLLRAVAKLKKPIFLSTGGATKLQIDRALHILNDSKVILFYCVAEYPANLIDPFGLFKMRSRYPNVIGYSDHSTDAIIVPSWAKQQGASYLEKHVNFLGYKDTPDATHSISLREFEVMAKVLRDEDVDFESLNNQEMRTTWQRREMTGLNSSIGFYRLRK